jgi:hypothetical protein
MAKKNTPTLNIDGASISKSITAIVDSIRYRKYAKEGYTTVIYINKENNNIKILDGKIGDNIITIRGMDDSFLVNKVYMLPTKKLVTKCCIIPIYQS